MMIPDKLFKGMLLAFACILVTCEVSFSQQWTGSSTLDGLLERNGNILINKLTLGSYNEPFQDNSNPYTIYSDRWSGTQDLLLFGNNDAILNLRLHDGALKIGLNTVPSAVIYNDGSAVFQTVGINTSNIAGYQLSVNGKIRASEVKVYTGWADFVFEPSYRLRPLKEVDAFIKEHGHLPEVPSAQEVAENGVDLGKSNALLLQKIEELTLYIIEQEKRTSELEERLRKLEE